MDTMNNKTMMSPREYARVSGLAINLTGRLCHVDGFPALRVGRRWLIHRERADEWLAHAAEEGINLVR